MHIEQARVLQDTGNRIGIVEAIAGYVHADVVVARAAATTRERRRWTSGSTPALVLAETVARARAARARRRSGHRRHDRRDRGDPGLINAIPGRIRFSLDIRGVDEDASTAASRATSRRSRRRRPRQRGMTRGVRRAADAGGDADRRADRERARAGRRGRRASRTRKMHSGAAHDTMCVADRVPTAMVFVPVQGRDQPLVRPRTRTPADAALAAEIILNAIASLQAAA